MKTKHCKHTIKKKNEPTHTYMQAITDTIRNRRWTHQTLHGAEGKVIIVEKHLLCTKHCSKYF